MPPDTHAVALAAGSEAELLELEAKLIAAGISHVAVREPDSPFFGQLMAIGVFPCLKEEVRAYLKKYKLLKGELK